MGRARALAALAVLVASGPGWAAELVDRVDPAKAGAGWDRQRFSFGGFVQPRFVWSPEDKAAAVPGEVGFQVARVRLEQQSTLSRAAAGEDGIAVRQAISIELMPEARLVDAYLDLQAHPLLTLRMGQFKTPTSRTLLISDKSTALPERAALDDLGPRRQIGAMLHGADLDNIVEYGIGAFNGEGTNRLGNVNRKLLYAGRVAVSPWGGPGTTSELLDPNEDPTATVGYAVYVNKDGPEGAEEASISHNGEAFAHYRWVTVQAELLWRFTDWQPVDLADFHSNAWYVQAASFVPGVPWADEHLALVGRYDRSDALVPINGDVPLVGPTDPAQGRQSVTVGLGLYAGQPWTRRAQDLRLQLLWSKNDELEDLSYDNDQVSLAAHLTF
jgi:hypothetical protein